MALLLGFYIRPGGMQEKVPYMTKFDRKHKKKGNLSGSMSDSVKRVNVS